MALTREVMVDRFLARDPAYELRFVVGVVTTGIYCVPTCSARKPKESNVRFFATLDDARRAGLRACKRCRPDHVHAGRDPEREALEAAVTALRRSPGDFRGVGDVARAAGCGATKLGELVREHYHTTPRALLVAARLRFARRELMETNRRVLSIAVDAGFEGATAFHDNFRRALGLAPGEYRSMGRSGELALRLPRGYPVEHLLRSLGRDPEGRTERVRGRTLARAIRVDGRPARVTVELKAGAARGRVEARSRLTPAAVGEAHEVLLRVLGLTIDPAPFERRARGDVELTRLIEGRRGVRIPQTPNAFEGLVWSIVGQQVNLAFAFTCRNRLIDLAGTRAGDRLTAHPTPEAVAGLDYVDLTRLQYSQRKAEYLIDTSHLIAAGELDLEGLAHASATRAYETLASVRGLGPWSVNYMLMRSLGFADCVPVGDAGLVRALQEFHDLPSRPGPDETLALMERYSPHRSLATFHLWKTLGDPT
ncbi:MAG: Ada metal-binding domain-containing protein [Planctomycetota bacterium]